MQEAISVANRYGNVKQNGKNGTMSVEDYVQQEGNILEGIKTSAFNNIFGQRIDKMEYLTSDEITFADKLRMKRDPQIRFGSLVKKFSILGQGWDVDQGQASREKTEFVFNNFKEIGNRKRTVETSFIDKLRQILSATDHGLSLTEKVWEIDNGRVFLADLKVRENELGSFKVSKDEAGYIKKIFQQKATSKEIPLRKLLIFSYLNEGDKLTGRSDLEAVWDAWFRKRTIKEFWSAYLELRSKINTVAKLEGRNMDSGLASKIWDMLKNMQLGGRMIVPGGVELDTVDMGQANENLFFKAIKYWDGQILKGFLTPHLVGEPSSEQSNTGSFALGETHFSVFMLVIRYLKVKLEEKINEGLIKPLIQHNYTNSKDRPVFFIKSFQSDDIQDMAEAIERLKNAGVITGDEEWIPKFVGIPVGDATDQAINNTQGIDGMESMVDEMRETQEKMKSMKDAISNQVQGTETYQQKDTGDLVRSPGGIGVIAGEINEDFRFPVSDGEADENTTLIKANEDEPAYVVGFVGSSAVYRASDLELLNASSADELRKLENTSTRGKEIARNRGSVDFEETDWADGWDEFSLMSFYASNGGEVSELERALQDERGFDEEDAIKLASEAKDQVLGTQRWRGRF